MSTRAAVQKRQDQESAPQNTGQGKSSQATGVGLPLFMQANPTLSAGATLQRKCACSGTPGANDECATCNGGKFLQAKLAIGASDDPLEQEADRVADQVLAMPANSTVGVASPRIQRYTGQATGEADTVPTSVERVLAGSGRPLEPALQQDMEQRFGHDFSRVRVHSSGVAEQSAQDVNAHAYTVGHDIVFGAGRFAPGTHDGRRLIAHELTHVVQQATPGASALMRKGFESTVEVCHRVLESRKFQVDNGGVRVVLAAQSADTSVPSCRNFNFGVTLTRSEDWWPDKEIGTCENHSGGIRVFKFANVPRGSYYLTFWRIFDNPNCCLEGDVTVFDEAQVGDGEGCERAKDLSTMDIVHGALDLAGFVPLLGAIPDGINAGIYVFEGDWANAGLSAVAAVPAWGDGIKLGTMVGKAVIKVEAKVALKLGEEGLAAELKALKAASETASAAKLEREAAEQAARFEREAAEKAASKNAGDGAKATTPAKDPPAASKKDKPAEKKKEKKPKKTKCTAAEIEAENLAMHVFCNKPRKCSMQGDTCETALAKVSAGMGCVDARVVLQQRCFQKGDPGYHNHMEQIAQASAALHNCEAVVKAKCT